MGRLSALLRNHRFFVLLSSVAIALVVFFVIDARAPDEQARLIRLVRAYALLALTYLYTALLAGPFCYSFPRFPYRAHYLFARRAIGVSAYFFALLHASLAFFGLLGGFSGLPFLSAHYLFAITLGATALVILFCMAATSFDSMVRFLTFRRWKFLHRFVYGAGFLVMVHALLLGTHFRDLSRAIPQIFFAALAFLLLLEGRRVDAVLARRWRLAPTFGIGTVIVCSVVFALLLFTLVPHEFIESLGLHGQH